jgi:hypothetical protein
MRQGHASDQQHWRPPAVSRDYGHGENGTAYGGSPSLVARPALTVQQVRRTIQLRGRLADERGRYLTLPDRTLESCARLAPVSGALS